MLFAEIERLTMINRELIKENNNLLKKNNVIPVSKVEKLLEVNETLRTKLEKLRADGIPTTPVKSVSRNYFPSENIVTPSTQRTGVLISTQSCEVTARWEFDTQKTDREIIGELRQQLNSLKDEKDRALLKYKLLHNFDQEKKELDTKMRFLNAEKERLQKSLSLKNEEIKKLENERTQTNQDLQHMSTELTQLKSELALWKYKYERDVKELETVVEKKDEEIKEYKERLNSLESCVDYLETIQRDKEIYEKALDDRSNEIEALKLRIESLEPLEKENKLLRQRFFLVRTAGELLKHQNEENIKRMEALQEVVSTGEILDVEVSIRKLMEERDVLAAQNERMKKPLQEKILKLDMLQFKVHSELEEFENWKKSLKQLDESQGFLSPIAFMGDVASESGKFKDEVMKTIDQKTMSLKNFKEALKDVNTIKSQMENMTRELEELNDEDGSESNPSDFAGFSKRAHVTTSYTDF